MAAKKAFTVHLMTGEAEVIERIMRQLPAGFVSVARVCRLALLAGAPIIERDLHDRLKRLADAEVDLAAVKP